MVLNAFQLQQLGYKFLVDKDTGEVFVGTTGGFSKTAGFEKLKGETKKSIEDAGYGSLITIGNFKNQDQIVSEIGSAKGLGYSGGDVKTLDDLNALASTTLKTIETALKAQPSDTIAIGNEDLPRSQLEAIVGGKIPFSEAALQEQYAAGEAAAKAKDEQIKKEQVTEEPKYSEKATQIKQDEDGTYSVIKAKTGEVLQSGLKTVATALAVGQQISGGSTPSLSGLPEVYATTPTQAELAAGIQPIMGSKGEIVIPVAAVNPELALEVEQTPENLKANKEVVNAIVEAYTGSPATQEQLDDLVGKKVVEVKEVVKQEAPINQVIKNQVEAIYGDVSKLTVEDIPDIAASPEAITKLETWNEQNLPTVAQAVPEMVQNNQQVQEKIQEMQEEVIKKSSLFEGIDETSLTNDQKAVLENVANTVANNPSLVTAGKLTDEQILEQILKPLETDFLGQAKGEFADYYSQLFSNLKKDFEASIAYQTEQRELELQVEEMNKIAKLEQTQAQMAEQGLAFSGIRQKAEEQLAKQAENIAKSSKSTFGFQTGQLGKKAEELLGSEYLAGAQLPILGGQKVFTPAGGIKGTLEAEKTTAEQVEAKELEKQAKLANLATIPGIDVDTFTKLASMY